VLERLGAPVQIAIISQRNDDSRFSPQYSTDVSVLRKFADDPSILLIMRYSKPTALGGSYHAYEVWVSNGKSKKPALTITGTEFRRGTHLSAFCEGLLKAVNEYAKGKFDGDDVRGRVARANAGRRNAEADELPTRALVRSAQRRGRPRNCSNCTVDTAVAAANNSVSQPERKSMKPLRKVVLTITATIIIAADANAGRWLSRDPIEEGAGFVQRDPTPEVKFLLPQQRNEPNLYAFVRNNPVNSIDLLGLCGSKCGVKSFKAISDRWYVRPTFIALHFHVTAKLKKDKDHSPSCCKLIQFVQDGTTLNGKILSASGGQPTDGKLHIDRNPYIDDDINNSSNYDRFKDYDTDPADDVITITDAPTRGGSPGDVLGGDLRFRFVIYDACNGMKEIDRTGFKAYWIGTWPTIDYGTE